MFDQRDYGDESPESTLSHEAAMLLRMTPLHRETFSVNERADCKASEQVAAGVRDLVAAGMARHLHDNPVPTRAYIRCATYELTSAGTAMRKAILK